MSRVFPLWGIDIGYSCSELLFSSLLLFATDLYQVKRAFRAWSTGQYVPLPKSQKRFSQNNWGYATNEVMESVDCLTPKQWKKIFLGAQKYVGAYHPNPTMDVVAARMRHPSGRAK